MCSLHLNTLVTRGCGNSVLTLLPANPEMLMVGILVCRLSLLNSGIGTVRAAVGPKGTGSSLRRMYIKCVSATVYGLMLDVTLTIRFWSRVLFVIEQPGYPYPHQPFPPIDQGTRSSR